MVSPETRTPSLEVGAGERVKMLEVEAGLSVNSESEWKVRGGSQREQRGDGRKEGRKRRGREGGGEMAASQRGFHLLTKPMRPATGEILVGKPQRERPLGGSGGGEPCPGNASPRPRPARALDAGACCPPGSVAHAGRLGTVRRRNLETEFSKCLDLISTSE